MRGVSLRPIALDDWRRVHEWASTEAACRHQPWGPNDEADTRQFVVDALAAWTNTASTRRVWAAQTPTDAVIGLGELKIRSVAHRQAEISYAVHTVLWGPGYGEAIARSLVEVGRAEGMHRIAGTCDPRNGASAQVLQKIGMSYEGRMRHTPEQPEKDEPGWSPTLRHQHGEPARAVAADPAVQAGPADLHRRPESDDVAAAAIEQMASTGGILADLFVRDQVA